MPFRSDSGSDGEYRPASPGLRVTAAVIPVMLPASASATSPRGNRASQMIRARADFDACPEMLAPEEDFQKTSKRLTRTNRAGG